MNGFERKFVSMARKEDPSILFTGFLDWVIDANLIALTDRKIDFRGREQDYFELYTEWVQIVDKELEATGKYYYDYLGVFYEDVIQSRYKAGTIGQFFTPHHVCSIMAKLCFNGNSLDGVSYDCACGSGRLLLASHEENPGNVVIGWDLDSQACKMAVCNLYIHGIRGSILCKNTLDNTFYEAWRVNNYLGYGLPVPHIELVSESEAYRFIGRNVESGKKEVVTAPEPPLEPVTSKPKNGTLEAWL